MTQIVKSHDIRLPLSQKCRVALTTVLNCSVYEFGPEGLNDFLK